MNCRLAGCADVSAIYDIEALSFKSPWSLDSLRADICMNDNAFYFVAEEAGAVVGFCGIHIVLDDVCRPGRIAGRYAHCIGHCCAHGDTHAGANRIAVMLTVKPIKHRLPMALYELRTSGPLATYLKPFSRPMRR